MVTQKQKRQSVQVGQGFVVDHIPLMAETQKPCKTESPGDALLRSLRILLQQIVSNKRNYDIYLSQSQRALAALPLTTGEYGQLTLNIQNVRKYLENQEIGAAKYELGLLLRRLPRLLSTM